MDILKFLTRCYFPHCKWLDRGASKTAWAMLIVNACFAQYASDFLRLPD
jgi:hypothetical protein